MRCKTKSKRTVTVKATSASTSVKPLARCRDPAGKPVDEDVIFPVALNKADAAAGRAAVGEKANVALVRANHFARRGDEDHAHAVGQMVQPPSGTGSKFAAIDDGEEWFAAAMGDGKAAGLAEGSGNVA